MQILVLLFQKHEKQIQGWIKLCKSSRIVLCIVFFFKYRKFNYNFSKCRHNQVFQNMLEIQWMKQIKSGSSSLMDNI